MKSTGSTILFAGFLVMGITGFARAQDTYGIGDRVRIKTNHSDIPLIGSVADRSPTAITLNINGQGKVVPIAFIDRLDLSLGRRRNTGRGIALGAIGGGLAGGLLGSAFYRGCIPKEFFDCFMRPGDRGEAFKRGVFIGMFVGGITGAIIGGNTIREKWHSIPFHVSMSGYINRFQSTEFAPTVGFRISLSR